MKDLPITGVVGVLAGDRRAVARLLDGLTGRGPRPQAVEIRADLFESPAEALDTLSRLPPGLPALFTVRLERQGGRFRGSEADRIDWYREALRRGAALLDVEVESDAARALAREGAPLIISHHDFQGMPEEAALERLTREMASLRPRAVKVVPTARRLEDAVRILEWVRRRTADEPPRVGFAMGEAGLPSRVFSLAHGAPFTYAALGDAVAPGQVSVADLTDLYRATRITRATRLLGVVGNPVAHSLSPHMHNRALAARGLDAVYLPLRLEEFADIEPILEPLGVIGLSVTIPFKEDALRFADEADPRSRSSCAANTLVLERSSAGRGHVKAYNTDFEGVLKPLARRGMDPRGLSAAIVGNGGAARGAARALADAGSRVTLYYRSPERGQPVAEALGVAGRPLRDLRAGCHTIIINATPLGLQAGDPSPVPADVFDADTIAFDMVYDPPETPFLELARSRGARTIPGREMLICQGLVQFRLFTGKDATHEEFEAAFLEGQASRREAGGSVR